MCVLAAVLDAVDLGLRVVLPVDALCSSSDESHEALLSLYRNRFSQQVETASAEADSGELELIRPAARHRPPLKLHPRGVAAARPHARVDEGDALHAVLHGREDVTALSGFLPFRAARIAAAASL